MFKKVHIIYFKVKIIVLDYNLDKYNHVLGKCNEKWSTVNQYYQYTEYTENKRLNTILLTSFHQK